MALPQIPQKELIELEVLKNIDATEIPKNERKKTLVLRSRVATPPLRTKSIKAAKTPVERINIFTQFIGSWLRPGVTTMVMRKAVEVRIFMTL